MPNLVIRVHESITMHGKPPRDVIHIRMSEKTLRRVTGMGAKEFERAVNMTDDEWKRFKKLRARKTFKVGNAD